MSGIKRYSWGGPAIHGMEVLDDGDYVLHADHSAEIAHLQGELDLADSMIARLRAEADANRVDAERYRWLRDTPWRENEKMEPVIRLQLNALWDEKIDKAMGSDA